MGKQKNRLCAHRMEGSRTWFGVQSRGVTPSITRLFAGSHSDVSTVEEIVEARLVEDPDVRLTDVRLTLGVERI
jgi:hypothetical protein